MSRITFFDRTDGRGDTVEVTFNGVDAAYVKLLSLKGGQSTGVGILLNAQQVVKLHEALGYWIAQQLPSDIAAPLWEERP